MSNCCGYDSLAQTIMSFFYFTPLHFCLAATGGGRFPHEYVISGITCPALKTLNNYPRPTLTIKQNAILCNEQICDNNIGWNESDTLNYYSRHRLSWASAGLSFLYISLYIWFHCLFIWKVFNPVLGDFPYGSTLHENFDNRIRMAPSKTLAGMIFLITTLSKPSLYTCIYLAACLLRTTVLANRKSYHAISSMF